MAIATPTQSLLAAHQTALNAWLATKLNFPWNYPSDTTDYNNSPKGFASITREGLSLAANLSTNPVTVGLAIRVAHTDEVEGSLLLKDWGEALAVAVRELNSEGITGSYRGHSLVRAIAGITPISDMEFPSESTPVVAGSSVSGFTGSVLWRLSYQLERVNVASFDWG